MKTNNYRDISASIELTLDELLTINNALNEVRNGIHLEGEFDTRMGCTVEEARKLLADIHELIFSMRNLK